MSCPAATLTPWASASSSRAARSSAQLARARADYERSRQLGVDDDLVWLEKPDALGMLGASDTLGAVYTLHCVAIDPVRLAVGLAAAVERRGGTIAEGSTVTRITPGRKGRRPSLSTMHGIVRATEGWSSQLADSKRSVVPGYSLMIATAPLGEDEWSRIGLDQRQTFSELRNMLIYGQRTADGRLAFGERGAPYHFGSAIDPAFDQDQRVFADLRATLLELFDFLGDVEITHTWGGPLRIPRDWFGSVGLDHSSGLAWAGGYVGDGVTTSNLAGRTLADLITGADSELVALPWVNHRSPLWEPEPLRWLGVNAGLLATRWADATEQRRGRPSRLAKKMTRLLGA